ncbi:MAG: hypothetical protein NC038_05575 [Paludibacter sp.]|nr:hypothetical protein [Bacteroidales bacterium]MCM1069842.1 hypothetical protein [Prevotella sp.]MCM1353965.1 hypothetical protein [Bacteroides sp.]MCM1443393.1 hypothetical protein [Muribaculum sp.]MCM1482096.1 hypothetical protein [Paludibacter sp.]
MKTIFEACPYTGKPTLTLIPQNDQERSLMNQLCSLTLEERVHHTRLRIDRLHDKKNQSVALCLRKKTFLHPDILRAMGFREITINQSETVHPAEFLSERFFYHPQGRFFVALTGTCRVWSRIQGWYLQTGTDSGSLAAKQVAKDENGEWLHLKLSTQSYYPHTERRYCQTVEELERFMKGKGILQRERP